MFSLILVNSWSSYHDVVSRNGRSGFSIIVNRLPSLNLSWFSHYGNLILYLSIDGLNWRHTLALVLKLVRVFHRDFHLSGLVRHYMDNMFELIVQLFC